MSNEFNQDNNSNINWAQLMYRRARNPESWQQAGQFVNTSYHNMQSPEFCQQMVKPIKQGIPATLNAADNFFIQKYGDGYLKWRNMQFRDGYPDCTPINLAKRFVEYQDLDLGFPKLPSTGNGILDNFILRKVGSIGKMAARYNLASSIFKQAAVGYKAADDLCF